MRYLIQLAFFWILLGAGPAAAQPCVADATHLCFAGNRFSAYMAYQRPDTSAAVANAVQPAGGAPGYFRFGNPAAAELWVDLLDGCAVNNKFWVVTLAVSNDGWTLQVIDHQSGNLKNYSLPMGSYGTPIVDIQAFDCAAFGAAAEGGDAPSPLLATTMDLFAGRFRVSAMMANPNVFVGQTRQLTRDSGMLSYFTPSRPDVLVKIFYPGNPGFFGVAGSWNQADTTLRVEDLCTGTVRTYHSGTVSTVGDPGAFTADDAACGLFSNGFESGDTAAWSLTAP